MRTETEMYALIINTAVQDDRIRAVYMNGSRTNPTVKKDIFQDYDVMYVVRDTAPFIESKTWYKCFGEILYMQFPDENPYFPADKENCYGWLMQFADGNRMDLHVESVAHAIAHIEEDSLCRILLDKDHLLPPIAPSTDAQYHVRMPAKEQYLASCNEFWWCTNNIAKGLWRKEIPYVQDMANDSVRQELVKLLSWKVGIMTNWSVSVGKSGKYLCQWLDEKEWQIFLSTYFGSDIEEAWQAVFRMCALFASTARYVGKQLGYVYNHAEGKAALRFLQYVHTLSPTADDILLV